MSWIVNVLLLMAGISVIEAGSRGAPLASCTSMNVNHIVFSPQTSPCPFRIVPEKLVSAQGDSINVTIETAPSKLPGYFSGFLLMAFDLYNEDAGPIGTLSIANDKGQYLSCSGKSQSAVTHINANLKTSVSVVWTPPAGYLGRVVFRTTFTENLGVFWVRVPSQFVDIVAEDITTTATVPTDPTTVPTVTEPTNTVPTVTDPTIPSTTQSSSGTRPTEGWIICAVMLLALKYK